MNVQIVRVDVIDSAIEGIQISMPGNRQNELMPLSVIVTVVAVVRNVERVAVLAAVRLLVQLVEAVRSCSTSC